MRRTLPGTNLIATVILHPFVDEDGQQCWRGETTCAGVRVDVIRISPTQARGEFDAFLGRCLREVRQRLVADGVIDEEGRVLA